MKLLFDVHCAGTYLGSKAEIDNNHSVICVGQNNGELPGDTPDDKIIEYSRSNDYTIVTKDIDLVKECCKQNVKVAVLKGNHIFLIGEAIKIVGREPPKELFSQN